MRKKKKLLVGVINNENGSTLMEVLVGIFLLGLTVVLSGSLILRSIDGFSPRKNMFMERHKEEQIKNFLISRNINDTTYVTNYYKIKFDKRSRDLDSAKETTFSFFDSSNSRVLLNEKIITEL